MSARSAVALQQGADEQLLDAVDHYRDSQLPAAQQAALTLADVYLGSPADLDDTTRASIAAALAPAQIVEIVLKLVGFSSDKVMVALGIDLDEVSPFTL